MKARINFSVDPFLWSKFEDVCKRMAWESKSLVIENALKQIIEQYELKPLVIVECNKCPASFSVALWDNYPEKYKKNMCISCGADLHSQLISNEDRSEEATQPARDQKSAVQSSS